MRKTKLAAVALAALSLLSPASSRADGARNVIVMVPDGMGLADVTATRIYKGGLAGSPLSFETLEHIGYQRTYSLNSAITDSAPAASAWACGEKFNNGEICLHRDGRPVKPSVLELARRAGKATALVATSTITHATPASFGAHVVNRSCENEIARQYVETTHVDVLLGAGTGKFNAARPDACGTMGNFAQEARNAGYAHVTTREELERAVAAGHRLVLGLFAGDGGMTPEYLRTAATTEPRLPEMTRAALRILERNHSGFFAMIEGSQVDWANHADNYDYQLGEMLAFDEAVAVVRAWIDADPERKEDTLLVVVADHDTGGFAVNGPQSALLHAGQKVEPGWTTGEHTGVDTIIWSQGPQSRRLARAVDNTDVYDVIVKALD